MLRRKFSVAEARGGFERPPDARKEGTLIGLFRASNQNPVRIPPDFRAEKAPMPAALRAASSGQTTNAFGMKTTSSKSSHSQPVPDTLEEHLAFVIRQKKGSDPRGPEPRQFRQLSVAAVFR